MKLRNNKATLHPETHLSRVCGSAPVPLFGMSRLRPVRASIFAMLRRDKPSWRRFPRCNNVTFLTFLTFPSGICSSAPCKLLLAFLLVVSWQSSAYSAPTANRGWRRPAHNNHSRPLPWGRYKKLARARSIDGIDYVEFESTSLRYGYGSAGGDEKKQPSPEGNNSSDSTTDLDECDNALDDLSADSPKRGDQDTSHLSVTDLDAVTLRMPRTIGILLLSPHSFYSLHEHIRERAPPILS